MKKCCAASVVLLTAVSVSMLRAGGPDEGRSTQSAPAIKTERVSFERNGEKFHGYVARPADGKPAPGLILIHEWWGLNDWVKKQADRYAAMGYVAVAPDLYRGELAKDAEHAHELMRGLADERAVGDMKRVFEWMAGSEFIKGKPVGVMGWCMGGSFALKLAIAEPRIACTVVCYGRPVLDVAELKKIKGPLLGIWGATDRGIEVPPFEKALMEAGVKAAHHVYPGAGHAFLNETNQRGYNKEQAEKGWKEIDAFLHVTMDETVRHSMKVNSKDDATAKPTEQCVIVYINLSKDGKRNGASIDLFSLEDDLDALIRKANVGIYDGNGIGQGFAELFMYGPSADRIFEVIRPRLRAAKLPPGSYAVVRYGEPGSKETRFDSDAF